MIQDQEKQKNEMNAFQHSFRPKDNYKWNSQDSNLSISGSNSDRIAQSNKNQDAKCENYSYK